MPFAIIKHGKCYSVVNIKTNKVHSRCSTLANAKKQERLLRAIEHGFKPTGKGLKRKVGLYPPSVRKLLSQVGKEPVKSIKIVRTPIHNAIVGLLNVISAGNYSQAVKSAGYDKMLHLALFINDTYQLDKQSVVVLTKQNPITAKSEVMEVKSIPQGLTIQSLLDKTKSYMGDTKFSNYEAFKNNCQDFVIAVLTANKMMTPDIKTFVKQDADAVLKRLPEYTEKLSNVITDIGAVADKIIQGENIENKIISHNKMTRKTNPWLVHVKKVMAQNKGKSFKQILLLAKSSYKK